MEDIDINKLREGKLVQIKEDVDRAFKNRERANYQPEIKNTTEALEEARENKAIFEGLTGDAIVEVGDYVEKAQRVSVENSHDYKDLLTIALEKLASEGFYREEDIPEAVRGMLKHEYEHHVPALGKKGLKVRYCVEFVEDNVRGLIGVRPSINLNGAIQVGVYMDIVSAVEEQSASDRIITE